MKNLGITRKGRFSILDITLLMSKINGRSMIKKLLDFFEKEERKKLVLESVVEEYIKTGEPVSSKAICFNYEIFVSSATIRNDFLKLTQDGYLHKLHASSGRVPTNKAWKFFRDNIVNAVFDGHKEEVRDLKESLNKKIRKSVKPEELEKLLEILAKESYSFGFCYLTDKGEVVKKGLKYVFSRALVDNYEEKADDVLMTIKKIVEAWDNLDEKLKKISIKKSPLILIGKENPFIKDDDFSSLMTETLDKKYVLGILGPKRMSYDRNLVLLDTIAEMI